MGKNIIWYSTADGSHGGCTADDLIICDADDLTPDESYALYEGSQGGDDDLIRNTMVSISKRQDRNKVMWTLVKCAPLQQGADAVCGAVGLFGTEDEALAHLADIRDDNPDTGDGWTTTIINVSAR